MPSSIALLRNEAVINPVKLVVAFSPRRLKYAVARYCYVTFSPLAIEIPYITHIKRSSLFQKKITRIPSLAWSPALRCGLALRARPGLSTESDHGSRAVHRHNVTAQALGLRRALRRMASLVFLLVFWVLADACQKHGVGAFFVAKFFFFFSSTAQAFLNRSLWRVAP